MNKLAVILKERNFALRDLIDTTFNADKTIAFRAAWLLENVFLADPDFYLTDLDYLLTRFKDVTYPSCQRHYAKVLMHITSPKALPQIKDKIQTANMEPVIEQCFDWMIEPEILIAVKAHAAEALFNLRHRYPWIAEELANQLQFLMKNGTAAIQTRGKRLLAKL